MISHPFFYFLKNNQIIFDETTKYIIIFNEGSLFLPVRVFNKIQIELINSLGLEEAEKFFKKIAYYQIDQAFKRYVKIYNFDKLPKDKILEFIKNVSGLMGIGNPSAILLDEKKHKILVSFKPATIFSFEVRKEYGILSYNFDIYTSKLIEKIFNIIYGLEFVCKEVKCYAKGDEECEFIAESKQL